MENQIIENMEKLYRSHLLTAALQHDIKSKSDDAAALVTLS